MAENPASVSVLLTTEGSYPFAEGGVSTWCDTLIRQLPDVQFTVLSLTALPGMKPAFDLPPNVVRHLPVPLWGTGAVMELRQEVGWRELAHLRSDVDSNRVLDTFGDAFALLIAGLLDDSVPIEQLGYALVRLKKLFQTADYDVLFRTAVVWEIFQREVSKHRWNLEKPRQPGEKKPVDLTESLKLMRAATSPSVVDAAEALRLLYRWLTPIAMPVPEVNLVHCSAAGLASLPGIVARMEHGTPFLLTEHGVYLRERYLAWSTSDMPAFVKQFASKVMRRLVELSYFAADAISPVSSWNARWEVRLGASPEKIYPIANGVDPTRFAPAPLPDPATPTLVWVGRIDPLKDLLTLIDAFALVREQIPNAELKLFGKAPAGNEPYHESCLARRAEHGLDDAVKFMGYASSPQHAYSQGHAVVLSSISEALPYSIIEAMLCGRSVVGTDVGGVPEVIGDTGRIVPPRDPARLAEALVELLRNPALCDELGAKARERGLQNYTLDQFVSAYRGIYELAGLYKPVDHETVRGTGREQARSRVPALASWSFQMFGQLFGWAGKGN